MFGGSNSTVYTDHAAMRYGMSAGPDIAMQASFLKAPQDLAGCQLSGRNCVALQCLGFRV